MIQEYECIENMNKLEISLLYLKNVLEYMENIHGKSLSEK